MANENPPRHLFLINVAGEEEPRPLLWREKQQERLDWMTRDYERRLARLNWLADDSLPGFGLWTGTEIFAEAFGCELHRPDNDMPSARPCVNSAEEAGKVKVPELSSSSLANIFEMADELHRRTGPNSLMRLPDDIQSPMNIAALIWDKSDFYVALMETPEAVRELAAKVGTLLTAFLDEWFRRYGTAFIAHYPFYYMERGVTLSEDEVGAVNPDAFEEFFLPELTHLSERYGGIGIHCCANARHQWNGLLKIPELRLLNIVHNPEMTTAARQVFAATCAQMHHWNGEGDPLTWPAQFPAGSRLIVEVSAQSPDEAKRLAEKMAAAYRRS